MDSTVDMAARRAELSPEAVAFVDDATGQALSFAAVEDRVARLAAALVARGLGDGAVVGLLCRSRVEVFLLLFAARRAGTVLALLNWRQPVAELAPIARATGLSAVIHDSAHARAAAGLAVAAGIAPVALGEGEADGTGPAEGLLAAAAAVAPRAAVPVDETRPWYLLFTSGTTGLPKAVIQTPRMALANAVNVAAAMGLAEGDRHLNFLPLFHTAGINLFSLPVFLFGGQTRILSRFDAPRVLGLIGAGEVTQFFGVPTIYQALAGLDGFDATDLTRVRGYACGGAALPEALIRRFGDRGVAIRNGFGMTETGPMGFLIDRAAALTRIGSIGKPQLMTEARLDGAPDHGPAEGEVLVRGPSVTPGYFNDPEATRRAFTADGWLRTGDVARRDADGYYRIVDRIKDMYISGGENVYPAEVERVLLTHPDIREAAVVGRPDPHWGETGVAYVICRAGAGGGDTGQGVGPGDGGLGEEALRRWCRARLAGYKVPAEIHVVADFPRTAAGKVRKAELGRGAGSERV